MRPRDVALSASVLPPLIYSHQGSAEEKGDAAAAPVMGDAQCEGLWIEELGTVETRLSPLLSTTSFQIDLNSSCARKARPIPEHPGKPHSQGAETNQPPVGSQALSILHPDPRAPDGGKAQAPRPRAIEHRQAGYRVCTRHARRLHAAGHNRLTRNRDPRHRRNPGPPNGSGQYRECRRFRSRRSRGSSCCQIGRAHV